MSTNNYRPHLHILPEDGANRALANGFVLGTSTAYSAVQILREANGWRVLLDLFESDHVPAMRSYPHRHMVLLIDFDNDEDRLSYVTNRIPVDLVDRVFVLGTESEPEDLKADFGPDFEVIGQCLAGDCRDETNQYWGHVLLRHNAAELERLRSQVRRFLFV